MRRKFLFSLISVLLLVTLSLSGCTTPPLDPAFTEDKVLSSAQEMIALLNERDYDSAAELFSDRLAAAIPRDTLSVTFDPILDNLGAFETVKDSIAYGATDEASGDAYAVAIVVCKYANGSAQYTLSFDKAYQLIGIYIK